MILFKLKPTDKSCAWFEEHKIDLRAMEVAISMLFSEVVPNHQTRIKNLSIQIRYGATCSDYTFTTDKIRLCDIPDSSARSNKRHKMAVFKHFLHEFRHWMQSKVFKVSGTKLTFDESDVERNTHAYFRNEYEIDARKFARTYLSKFYRYYKTYEQL